MKRTVVIKKKLIAEEEARLLKLVHANPGLSRLEIARHMRLSTAAAGYYVDRLLKDRFLLTGESIRQARGRPKEPLYMNEHIGCFLGLDISGSYIRASCLDFGSNILFQNRTAIPDNTPNEKMCGLLADVIQELKGHVAPPFLGIGLSVPVIGHPVPQFAPVKLHDIATLPIADIARQLSESFAVPVIHETSINALGYGEIHYGAGLRYKNCVSILARTDVSACVVIDGRLAARKKGHEAAGMIGQWMCPRYLLPKQTGVRMESVMGKGGAALPAEVPVEQLASTWGMTWQIGHALDGGSVRGRRKKREPLTVKDIRLAYGEGDPLVRRHAQAAATALAWAIGQLVLLFHPEQVILSGPISELGQPFLESLRGQVAKRLGNYPWDPAQVNFSELGEYSVAIGSAASSLDKWRPSR